MKRELAVWIEGQRVGRLEAERGLWRLSYETSWLAHPGRFALSPHLPLRAEALCDDSDDRPVQWFFDNLLPEGLVRESFARLAGLPPTDSFGLLERYGEESAGAITLLPPEKAWPGSGDYEPLSEDDLLRMLKAMPRVPLLANEGRARMSLAGAQHKLALHRRDSNLLRPVAGAASSIILKPNHLQADLYPSTVCNEHFCMALARRVGISAPSTEILRLPEPLYVVHRYDRRPMEGTDAVARTHQVDLCQLLNRWPGYKYESDGGATLHDVFGALAILKRPAVARKALLRWLIFNYVIGNSDAHAKNISFLVDADGIALAPAYDLLCVRAYGLEHDQMAMTIAEEVRYGWVEAVHWETLARSISVKPRFVRQMLAELAKAIPAAAREVLEAEAFTGSEMEFLGTVLQVIDTHAGYLAAAARG